MRLRLGVETLNIVAPAKTGLIVNFCEMVETRVRIPMGLLGVRLIVPAHIRMTRTSPLRMRSPQASCPSHAPFVAERCSSRPHPGPLASGSPQRAQSVSYTELGETMQEHCEYRVQRTRIWLVTASV